MPHSRSQTQTDDPVSRPSDTAPLDRTARAPAEEPLTADPTSPTAQYASAALSDPVEADALVRAQAGDHQAFAQLYSLHKRRIYSLCLRMVGNIAEAEDLTQEAFLDRKSVV